MLIASRQKLSNISERPSLTINDMAMEQVASAKSLGVYIHQNLNWECHIESISKKTKDIPFNIVINFYYSYVQPHFDYCNEVWGNCNKGLSNKLQKLQNRASLILMSAGYDSNLDDLFQALGWRKLFHQRLDKK